MNQVVREEYLSQLALWRDKQVIKVITGIRRSGKSTLLHQFQQVLMADGIAKSQILSINFEDLANEHFTDYRALHKLTGNHYPKYLITLDNDPIVSHDGITQVYALDWLLGEI